MRRSESSTNPVEQKGAKDTKKSKTEDDLGSLSKSSLWAGRCLVVNFVTFCSRFFRTQQKSLVHGRNENSRKNSSRVIETKPGRPSGFFRVLPPLPWTEIRRPATWQARPRARRSSPAPGTGLPDPPSGVIQRACPLGLILEQKEAAKTFEQKVTKDTTKSRTDK
jgi:hypothetical protein